VRRHADLEMDDSLGHGNLLAVDRDWNH